MSHALDLDSMRDFGERARALFDELTLRVYTAALIGRLRQRAPYGGHRSFPLIASVAQQVAFNDSKDRALLVYADTVGLPTVVVYSPSADSGSTNLATPQDQAGGVPPSTFVLKPGEQLFARSILATVRAVVATEWY